MIEAIRQYLNRGDTKKSFEQEALASWVAYQETGRHLTGEEVGLWLVGWCTDGERALPDCHAVFY